MTTPKFSPTMQAALDALDIKYTTTGGGADALYYGDLNAAHYLITHDDVTNGEACQCPTELTQPVVVSLYAEGLDGMEDPQLRPSLAALLLELHGDRGGTPLPDALLPLVAIAG